jgi:hypothetical protein
MKTNRIIQRNLAALALLSAFSLQPSALLGQGSLTPPGAPAPTMKTADQIEPRTIVNAANTPGNANNLFIITNSGSYYLTTNLVGVSGKNGIEIITNNVTLDLNGFALVGMSSSQNGIAIPNAQTNITVRNGTISGWGNFGVSSKSFSSLNQVFERLNVSDNLWGIVNEGAGVVRDCNCENSFGNGIYCRGGISGGIISGFTANNNGGDGIDMGSGTVSGCSVQNNGGGIWVEPAGTVLGCFVANNGGSGIYVTGGSKVIGNTCIGNNTGAVSYEAGIYIVGTNNRVEDNNVTASGYAGIQVVNSSYATNNLIIKNSVSGNGANNYVLPAGQIVGPLITNTVSGIITNSNPWANFSF